jgi:adenosine deaminase CECR1
MPMPDDLWEELSQDIPSTSDPFVQQYLAGRESLISKEKETRSDASFRKALTPIARRACAIVDRIRAHEQATVWTPNVEEQLAQETKQSIFPGMMFMLAKERMEQTNLWKIVRRMPKGCLLHAHMDAMVDFDFILDELLKTPGMHMSSNVSLKTYEAREDAVLRFRFRAKERVDGSIWDEAYEGGSFLLLTKVADEFPEGGRPGFLKWLKSRCTLSLVDSHEQHHGVDAIWEKFAKCFVVVATMIHYEPMFRAFLRRLMGLLKADGVNWAELRYEFSPFFSRISFYFIL